MTTPRGRSVPQAARSVLAALPLVTRRRARRDVVLLLAWTALVAFVVLLAVAAPRQVAGTIDRGARQAVADAGPSSDILIQVPVGFPPEFSPPEEAPGHFLQFVKGIEPNLPSGIREVYGSTTEAALGTHVSITNVSGANGRGSTQLRLGMLTPANRTALTVLSGRLPVSGSSGSATSPIEIALSDANARAADLHVGSIVNVATNDGQTTSDGKPLTAMKVVGIVERGSSGTANWLDTPSVWAPEEPATTSAGVGITALTTPTGVATAASEYGEQFAGYIRVHLDAQRFSGDIEPEVARELAALTVDSGPLVDQSGASVTVSSRFADALSAYPAEARAALAQMSLVLASLIGVAIAVLILVSRLVVLRRGRELAIERARGSSLPSIVARMGVESLAVTMVAGLIGFGLAAGVEPGPVVNGGVLLLALFVGLLAAPLQAAVLVHGQWTGRKTPANRQARLELRKRATARRVAAEVTVLLLAIAAELSLSSRGLLETASGGIDLFLAAAPLLFVIVVTLVMLRLYRWPVRAIGAIGRGTRGVLGVLGAARAETAVSALPLLALTLAVSLSVGGSVLIASVDGGQVAASWQRVGADVRVDAPVSPEKIASISHLPGVTAVGAANVTASVEVEFGAASKYPTMFAIDRGFAGLVSHLPVESDESSNVASLRKLGAATSASTRLPVVVNPQLASHLVTNDIAMYYGSKTVEMRIIGVTDVTPSGYEHGPFFYVDLDSLAQRLARLGASNPDLSEPNTVLITGPGATHAATSLGVAKTDIASRADWLTERRNHQALVGGTQQTMLLATIAVALLAVIALVTTALAGARDRGRSLSLLRTLGMRAGLGWWLALAELLPVVVASLIGGLGAGIGMVVLLEPSLGLRVLAGGESEPPTVISPGLIIGLVAAAVVLTLVAIVAETLAYRRDQLSEVLRVGESV
jgi:putative ABC transport system permease protein